MASDIEKLINAIESKDIEAVSNILNQAKTKLDLNAPIDTDKNTLLHKAAFSNVAIVKLLIAKGAAVNTQNSDHKTPIFSALAVENIEIAKVFLDKLVLDQSADKTNILETSACYAAKNNHLSSMQLLIENGVDIDKIYRRTPGFDYNLLYLAIKNGYVEMAKLLIDKKADLNILYYHSEHHARLAKRRDMIDIVKSPLDIAVQNANTEMVELLLDNGADPNKGSNPALHLAAKLGHKDIVELLIAKGANLEELNYNDLTPIEIAKQAGHKEIADILATHMVNKPTKNLQIDALIKENGYPEDIVTKILSIEPSDPDDEQKYKNYVCNISLSLSLDPVGIKYQDVIHIFDRKEITTWLTKDSAMGTNPVNNQPCKLKDIVELDQKTINGMLAYIKKRGDELSRQENKPSTPRR